MVSNRDLPEDEFFAEKYGKDPFPLWLWFFVVVTIAAVSWGSYSWWSQKRNIEISGKPFLQVTNRDFSLFLWQFPQYMRVKAASKTGYLPAFQELGGVGVTVAEADDWVQANQEVLFLYHTWDRLLKEEYYPRTIPVEEFKQFLQQTQVWNPANWEKAPQPYKELIARLPSMKQATLDSASNAELPLDVRLAFQGWRNYFKEGKEIDAVSPTYDELLSFLAVSPHYERNYWRNILIEGRPDYLKSIETGDYDPEAKVPEEELSGFLKVAFYNYTMARRGQ